MLDRKTRKFGLLFFFTVNRLICDTVASHFLSLKKRFEWGRGPIVAHMLVTPRWSAFDTARHRVFHYVSHVGQPPRHGAVKAKITRTSNVLESIRTVSVDLTDFHRT